MNPIQKALAQADKITAANAELERLSRPAIVTYTVTIGIAKVVDGVTAHDQGVMEVPSTIGAEAAGRRALITAASIGWGDLDELTVASSVPSSIASS